MAHRVTEEDKIRFNDMYLECKNYSQVARETGFSASTVRKYIIKDYKASDSLSRQTYNMSDYELKEYFDPKWDLYSKDWGILSEEEREDIKELWREIVI